MSNNSRLPSILLTLILITGITICFRHLDFSLMNEVKAIISIVFGFITSCMLLSFIWMIQRKSLHTIWSEQQQQQQAALDENEIPNMHPRVRADYEVSLNGRQSRSNNISTISSMVEQPPNYEDALINSKPINWIYLGSGKISNHSGSPEHISACPPYKNSSTSNEVQNSFHISSPSSGMAQIAMCIVKNFAPISSPPPPPPTTTTTIQQVLRSQSLPEYNRDNTLSTDAQQQRKPSYFQLDVSKLMLAESPPKYSELSFGNDAYTNRNQTSID